MEIWIAIIGVAGTLLGTLLGFFLNYFANKGTIKFISLGGCMTNQIIGVFFDFELINTNYYPINLKSFFVKTNFGYKSVCASQRETVYTITNSYGENPFKSIYEYDFKMYDTSLIRCEAKSRIMIRLNLTEENFTKDMIKELALSKKIILTYADSNGKKKKRKINLNRVSSQETKEKDEISKS